MNEYKLVPVKPTPEMVSKGARLLQIMSLPEREAASVFRAMLAAAPDIQREPVGYVSPRLLDALRSGKTCGITMEDKPDTHNGVTIPLYAAPQPAGQQPKPISRNLRAVHAMILSALDRDAADGKAVRGEMAAELRSALSEQQSAECTLNADCEQVTEVEAPSHSLPNWNECNLRVGNSKWLKDTDRKAEHDSLTANPLHEFIYEYDDSDAYKSAWFLHRLEKLIDFVRSEQQPAPIFGDEDHVSIPRRMIAAACSAIDRKRDASKVLDELRRYTVGDLSRQTDQQPAPQTEMLARLGGPL